MDVLERALIERDFLCLRSQLSVGIKKGNPPGPLLEGMILGASSINSAHSSFSANIARCEGLLRLAMLQGYDSFFRSFQTCSSLGIQDHVS